MSTRSIPTPYDLEDLINSDDLDERFYEAVTDYMHENEKYSESIYHRMFDYDPNPYEKALIVNEHDNPPAPYVAWLVSFGIPSLRADEGTEWKWEYPEAIEIAEENGLYDPDLIDYSDGVYTFRDHSDRFACMSDDYSKEDNITIHKIDTW